MKTIEIPINKERITKLALLLLFVIIFGISFSYYLYLDNKYSIKLIIVLIFAVPFCIYFLLLNIKKIINKNPGLIINNSEIINSTNFSKYEKVKWNNIVNAKLIEYNYSYFLIVYLKNNEVFYYNQNSIQKIFSKYNADLFGSPFIINASNLKIDKTELLNIIKNNIKTI